MDEGGRIPAIPAGSTYMPFFSSFIVSPFLFAFSKGMALCSKPTSAVRVLLAVGGISGRCVGLHLLMSVPFASQPKGSPGKEGTLSKNAERVVGF